MSVWQIQVARMSPDPGSNPFSGLQYLSLKIYLPAIQIAVRRVGCHLQYGCSYKPLIRERQLPSPSKNQPYQKERTPTYEPGRLSKKTRSIFHIIKIGQSYKSSLEGLHRTL